MVFKETAPLIVEEQFTGQQSPVPAIIEAFNPLEALLNNKFEPVELEHVSLEITVKESIQFAEIVGVRVRNNVVKAGDIVEANITLRPYNDELITVSEEIRIPEDIRQSRLQLMICDAKLGTSIETMRARAKFQPQNLSQLRELLQDNISRNTIVMSLLQLKPGAVVLGRELPAPPISMLTLMSSSARHAGKNSLTRGRLLEKKRIPTHYVISGCTALELVVNHSATDGDFYTSNPDARPKEN